MPEYYLITYTAKVHFNEAKEDEPIIIRFEPSSDRSIEYRWVRPSLDQGWTEIDDTQVRQETPESIATVAVNHIYMEHGVREVEIHRVIRVPPDTDDLTETLNQTPTYTIGWVVMNQAGEPTRVVTSLIAGDPLAELTTVVSGLDPSAVIGDDQGPDQVEVRLTDGRTLFALISLASADEISRHAWLSRLDLIRRGEGFK